MAFIHPRSPLCFLVTALAGLCHAQGQLGRGALEGGSGDGLQNYKSEPQGTALLLRMQKAST